MIPSALQNLGVWTIQASVLTLVGLFLPRVFRLRDPRTQLTYCRLLLLLCLALPMIQPWQHPIANDGSGAPRAFSLTDAGLNHPEPSGTVALATILLCVFAAGSICRFLWFATGLWRIRQYRTAAVHLTEPPASIRSAQRLVYCKASILISEHNVGPVTFGLFHPVVLLPASFLSLGEDEQRAIVCHELLHVRRRDWLANMIEELIGLGLWFQPAILLLIRRIRLLREQVVDHEVLGITAAPDSYVDALLAMAGLPSLSASAPSFLGRRHFAERMRSILIDHSMSRLRLASSYFSITIVLMITGVVSFISFPLIGDPLVVPYTSPSRNASNITQPVRKERSGQVFRLSDDGITRPVVLQRVDPQYSDSAREARIQGTVVLEGIVETDGSMTVDRVARGLDSELDHNAVYALEQWRFTPATKNGVPVRFALAIEVNFNVK